VCHCRLILALAVLSAIIAVATLIGCQNTGMDTPEAMKSSLEKEIPVGTSVPDAELRLKRRDFSVSDEIDASWGDRKHLNYLYGDRREGFPVEQRWQVAVFYEHGIVTGIDVDTGLVGP
jgi:hypothetical protein